MTRFYYVYEGWEGDEALDKIFSFVIKREIPLDLWELMKEDAQNIPWLFKRVTKDGEIKGLKIPFSVLINWIELEMYFDRSLQRVIGSIFRDESRCLVRWSGQMKEAILLYDWDMANSMIDDWISIQNDWFSEERGRVFQKDRCHVFYSRTLAKWVSVKQFQTMGKHINKGTMRFTPEPKIY